MEKSRFDELMRKFPNWISEDSDNQVYTFFDGQYTRSSYDGIREEAGSYILEQEEREHEEDGFNLVIELEESGKRYLIQGTWEMETPVLEFLPIDNSGDEALQLIPKNLKVFA